MKLPKPSFKSFFFELIIVFVGVYGAFELNRFQESQRDDRIKINYFNSFNSELVKLSADIQVGQGIINDQLAYLDSAMAAGSKPKLKPLLIYLEAQMLITKAGFNDDVFTQMRSDLAASLSGGYDHVQLVSKMTDNFNEACRMHLIDNEVIEFYDRKGKLKPQFEWYLTDLRNLKFYYDRLYGMISNGAIPATKVVLDELN